MHAQWSIRNWQCPAASRLSISEAFGNLGRLYHAYDLLDLAEVCYENAGQLYSTKPDWPYLYAVVNQLQGDNPKAIDAYKYVLKLDPAFDPARIRLARAHRAENQLEAAKTLLTELNEKMPGSSVIIAELGELALAEGDNATAIDYLNTALKAVPKANRLHYPLALAYRNLGNQEEARSHMKQRGDVGIAINDPVLDDLQQLKTGERVQLLQGKLAFNAGDYLAAADAFREALKAKPDSVRAHINLASALGMLGQKSEAIEHYNQAIKLEEKSATAHYNLGVLYLETQDLDNASKHFQSAISIAPKDSSARLYLAAILLKQNQRKEAFEQYKSVIQDNPASSEAWMGLSRLLVSSEQYGDALKALTTANEKLPHDIRITHALARLLAGSPDMSIRDAAKARPLAFRAYKERPTLGHAMTAAMALGESGNCLEAAILLEGAIKEQPQQVQQTYVRYYKTGRRLLPEHDAMQKPARVITKGGCGHTSDLVVERGTSEAVNRGRSCRSASRKGQRWKNRDRQIKHTDKWLSCDKPLPPLPTHRKNRTRS